MLASVKLALFADWLLISGYCRRVSLVDFRGTAVLDTYVRPTMQVSDYRTSITGIEARHLNSG